MTVDPHPESFSAMQVDLVLPGKFTDVLRKGNTLWMVLADCADGDESAISSNHVASSKWSAESVSSQLSSSAR